MSLLPPEQRQLLHRCILNYIRSQVPGDGAEGETGEQTEERHVMNSLAKWLRVDPDGLDGENAADGSLLPRKWSSIVRLQRRIIELEKEIQELTDENENLRENGPSSPANGALKSWLPRERPSFSISAGASVTSVKLHPELPLVFIATDAGKLQCYDLMNYTMPVASVQAHMRGITAIDALVGEDSQCLVATASKDLHCKVFRFVDSELQLIRTLSGHEHIVSHIKIWNNSTNTLVASCSRDLTCKVWGIANGWCLKSFQSHTEWVRCLDVMGDFVVTGSNDCTVRLSHWPTGRSLSFGTGHEFPVEKIRIIPLQPPESAEHSHRFNTHDEDYLPLGFSHVISTSRDGTLRIWQVPLPRFVAHRAPQPNPARPYFNLVATLKGHSSWVRDVRVRGKHAFSCSDDRSIKVWDLSTCEVVRSINNLHSGFINCIDIDCGGLNRQLLVSGGADGKLVILMK